METENLNINTVHDVPLPADYAALEYWKFAIEKNRVILIDVGVQIGLNLNARTEWGWSAVAHAVLFGRLACLRHLLDHGAEANIMSDVFVSPLTLANTLKYSSIADTLTKHLKTKDQLNDMHRKEMEVLNPFQAMSSSEMLHLVVLRLERERL